MTTSWWRLVGDRHHDELSRLQAREGLEVQQRLRVVFLRLERSGQEDEGALREGGFDAGFAASARSVEEREAQTLMRPYRPDSLEMVQRREDQVRGDHPPADDERLQRLAHASASLMQRPRSREDLVHGLTKDGNPFRQRVPRDVQGRARS